MKDLKDWQTPDAFTGETTMIYQVNYKYIHDNGKIRNASIAVTSETEIEAKKKALVELKKEHDHLEITSCKQWK